MSEDEYAEGQIWVMPHISFSVSDEYFRGFIEGRTGLRLDRVREGRNYLDVADGLDAYVLAVPVGREQEIADLLSETREIDWASRRNLSLLERSRQQDELERMVGLLDLDESCEYDGGLRKIVEYIHSLLPKRS